MASRPADRERSAPGWPSRVAGAFRMPEDAAEPCFLAANSDSRIFRTAGRYVGMLIWIAAGVVGACGSATHQDPPLVEEVRPFLGPRFRPLGTARQSGELLVVYRIWLPGRRALLPSRVSCDQMVTKCRSRLAGVSARCINPRSPLISYWNDETVVGWTLTRLAHAPWVGRSCATLASWTVCDIPSGMYGVELPAVRVSHEYERLDGMAVFPKCAHEEDFQRCKCNADAVDCTSLPSRVRLTHDGNIRLAIDLFAQTSGGGLHLRWGSFAHPVMDLVEWEGAK